MSCAPAPYPGTLPQWRAGIRLLAAGAWIAAGAFAPATTAFALWDDRLELFVSQTITRDDNVFRISESLDPAVVLGSSSKGDTYSTTSLGFNLDAPVSRQRLQARLAWNITRYERFTVLNLDDGHDGRVAWLWRVGNDLDGRLEYSDTRALASLANTRSGVLFGTPNVLATRRALFNGAYLVTPRWRLRGDVSRLRQSNELPALQVNDVTIDDAGLTLSYVTPANNEAGLRAQVEDGQFPSRQPVAGTLVDNSYRQQRIAAVADWAVTAQSRIAARAGWVSRDHAELPQRDVDGATYYAAFDWKPTGKLALAAVAQRDIVPLDDIYSQSVKVKGVALRASLALTEKLGLSASGEYSHRDYLADPALLLGVVSPRSDTVRAAAAVASYRPARLVTLQMGLRRETRSSTVAFGDYAANIFNVGVRIGF